MPLNCFHCGADVEPGDDHDCPTPSPVSAADGCPMCDQEYDEWFHHLTEECPGGERTPRRETKAATASDGSTASWSEDPL